MGCNTDEIVCMLFLSPNEPVLAPLIYSPFPKNPCKKKVEHNNVAIMWFRSDILKAMSNILISIYI